MKKTIVSLLVGVISLVLSSTASAQTLKATVIELTQTTGQFDNQKLHLKAGEYQFRVVNKDVDKDLGFVIQKESDKNADVMKTAIPNSFTTALIKKGKAEYTGVVKLEKGTYVYSCPLNPTPHYTIIVD